MFLITEASVNLCNSIDSKRSTQLLKYSQHSTKGSKVSIALAVTKFTLYSWVC